jgi:hypothetical protein
MRAVFATLVLLTTTGCYNLISISVGANHEAANVGPPPITEVQCAALAQTGVKAGTLNIEAMQACEHAAIAKAKEKKQ